MGTLYYCDNLIVSNGTLTVDGVHSFEALLLKDDAVLTHSPALHALHGETDNRLDLTITNNLTVGVTSRIDANAKGYGQFAGPGAGTNDYCYASGGGHSGVGGSGGGRLGYVWGGGVPQRFFRGALDEVMIFSCALSAAEIASLYFNQGSPLPLSTQPTAEGVLLSSPASAASFGLVSRTNLTAGAWESVTNAPSLNGDRKEVLLPANTPAHRFFRLAQ
jgi:hypothetical protein